MPDTRPARIRYAPWLPVATLALVFLAEGWFYGRFALSSPELALPRLDFASPGGDFSAIGPDFLSRYSLHVSATALTVLWLVLVVISIGLVLRETREPSRRFLRFAMLLFPAGYTGFLAYQSIVDGKNHILVRVPRRLIRQFEAVVDVPGLANMENLLSAAISGSLCFLVVAASALALPAIEVDLGRLRRRTANLERLLYASAALLVVAIVHIDSLLHWPVHFLPEADGATLGTMASGYSTVNGFYWSLLLAAVYLPTSHLLRREAEVLADQKKVPKSLEQRRRWFDEQGLSSTITNQATRLGAMLGPLIAGGPLTSLMDLARG